MKEIYSRGQLYQLVKSVNSPRSQEILKTGPGKIYPRFCIIISALLIMSFLSYLPFLKEKPKKPVAFVWPSNQTRDVSSLVQLGKDTTIMSPKGMCSHNSSENLPPPYLLIVVCSAVHNSAARMAIRNSWAKDTQTILHDVRVVFLVGELFNGTDEDKIVEESDQFGDILQEEFIDSYQNLTLKSLMLLKWFTTSCDKGNSKQSIQYLMKTDDDMYVNLVKLYELVRNNKKPNLLVGTLICNAVPIKDPYNKWYVPSYMFSEKRFPPYLSGTGYLMHRGTAFKLLSAATTTPVFHLEDIYITGILSRKVNIRPLDNIGFSYSRRQMNSCLFRQSITTHRVKHGEMAAIYNKVKDTRNTKKCPILKSRLIRGYGPGRCKWSRTTRTYRQ